MYIYIYWYTLLLYYYIIRYDTLYTIYFFKESYIIHYCNGEQVTYRHISFAYYFENVGALLIRTGFWGVVLV